MSITKGAASDRAAWRRPPSGLHLTTTIASVCLTVFQVGEIILYHPLSLVLTRFLLALKLWLWPEFKVYQLRRY
ncbi:hypothetical protein AAHA92_24464 [Salvia divinorum]|uniref:Uncharacterized protein n=1 Tax=Salvia divinorum TaxID=28513 RepID=A0ABD1G7G3_SALDI